MLSLYNVLKSKPVVYNKIKKSMNAVETSTFSHLSTRNSQHLSERHDGSSTMKVHQVMQKPVIPVFPHYDVRAIFQCINHKVSAAVLGTDWSVH